MAILAAADRLLAGTPRLSTGNLSVVQLATEADVKYWVVAQKHTSCLSNVDPHSDRRCFWAFDAGSGRRCLGCLLVRSPGGEDFGGEVDAGAADRDAGPVDEQIGCAGPPAE
jgi:hypothetical protein